MNCPLLPTPRGGLYAFTGSVSNSGNVTLVSVFVLDDQLTNNTPIIGPIALAPGASVNFTNSYIAPTCCCLIIDTLTAIGQDHCSGSNVTAMATAVCPVLTIPSIALVQECPTTPIPMGSDYVFSGYVTNTGDAVLTNVSVYSVPREPPRRCWFRLNWPQVNRSLTPVPTPFRSTPARFPSRPSGRTFAEAPWPSNSASCPVANLLRASLSTENCPPRPGGCG